VVRDVYLSQNFKTLFHPINYVSHTKKVVSSEEQTTRPLRRAKYDTLLRASNTKSLKYCHVLTKFLYTDVRKLGCNSKINGYG